jgi:ATP-binding cassette subfamily F protein uup
VLVYCQGVSKAFGATPLFEGLSFGVEPGQHVGLVGPNGSGKSTLLRILAGFEAPSSGTRTARKRLRLAHVPQDPVFVPEATIRDVLTEALGAGGLDPSEHDARLAVAIGQAGFADPAQPTATLSGGFKKRLAIVRAGIAEPELLLLDEPTNHLDVDGILWLEAQLREGAGAFVAVSHDRYFLEAVAGRMWELNRVFATGLLDVDGNYSRYLEVKDAVLADQAAYRESLRNRVRGEIEWLSRQAKARRRKSQARIGEAGRRIDELASLDARTRTRAASLEFDGTDRRTKRLIVAHGLCKSVGGRLLVRGLDLVLSPGMRLGLVGANGSGKTTLLRLLAGLDAPDAGGIERADGLRVVVFDQHRAPLDPEVSLRRTLAPTGDVVVHGDEGVHVASWAKRFLFDPGDLDTPVGRLSGGEQARVLLARLMLIPADVLMLDEPTNDLDIPTLEVLEESLLEFAGALVLVTHDRYLLDRVSTSLLALDGRGGVVRYADYAQWERSRDEAVARGRAAARSPGAAATPAKPDALRASRRRLSYLEQREWDQIEARIVEAEAERAARADEAADPAIASDHGELSARLEALGAAQRAVDGLYARWAELDAKRG